MAVKMLPPMINVTYPHTPVNRAICWLLVALLVFASMVSPALGQTVGGAQGSEPRFHVVRSVSGSKGSQQGNRYVIDDPRSTFYMPQDKTVIVYFEWDGPIGKHHLEGYWKNSEGKTVVISDFNFESREKRFGGYWSLNLTDGTAPGVWSLEARVDGEVTGTHSFQIVAAEKPAGATPAEPQPLPPAQIYERALAATVTLDKLSASGERVSRGSGFLIGNQVVLTAFEVIDGATSIGVLLPGGQHVQVNELVRWNRWQDWALFKIPIPDAAKLNLAQSKPAPVGDRCLYLNLSGDGSRNIVDTNITGVNTYPNAGQRLTFPYPSGSETVGSPLLNEYGDVIGIIAGDTTPGASSIAGGRFNYFAGIQRSGGVSNTLAVPVSFVSDISTPSKTVAFADLLRNGEFTPPLVAQNFVGQGMLALRLDNRAGVSPLPQDEKYEFTRKDQQFIVFMMWTPKEKRNTTTVIHLYDRNNNLLLEGKPSKLNLRPGEVTYTSWQIGLGKFSTGTYRIDVMLGDQPAWRSFFSFSD